MADLKLYGHANCPKFAASRDFLMRSGAVVQTTGESLPAELALVLGRVDGPVAVRGARYVTGGDPARLQSLMY